MKFKTRLLVVVMGLTLLSNGLLLVIFYHEAAQYLREQISAKALSIAVATAATIDGDELRAVQRAGSMTTPLYKKYERLLRQIRDGNRRRDTYINYIFTIYAAPDQPAQFLFGVDAQEPGPAKSSLGARYLLKSAQPYLLQKAAVQADFVYDQWGEWLEAHAPIYDRHGVLVGAVGVDIDDAIIMARLHKMLLMGYLALSVALLAALLLTYLLARHFAKPLALTVKALNKIARGDLTTHLAATSRDEFGAVAAAINNMTLGLRQRDNLKLGLARYVSNQVAEKIIETDNLPEVQGERRKITVLFCDVRNFTALAESLPPEDVVGLLDSAFEIMIDAIFAHQGMLDKFLGDGFMAIFGAPLDDAAQEAHAVQAALALQTALRALTALWRRERDIDFRIGIGIHTGIAVVGNIGSQRRMEYTAIGDTVNVTARLEAATKEFGAQILLSESTRAAVAEQFDFQAKGALQVKGRQGTIAVFEVAPPP